MRKLSKILVSGLLCAVMTLGAAVPSSAGESSPLKAAIQKFKKMPKYAENYEEVYNALKGTIRFYTLEDNILDYETEEVQDTAGEDRIPGDSSFRIKSEKEAYNSPVQSSSDMASDGTLAKDRSAESTAEHSETNLRDQNVDEADIVKTDGKYIYSIQDSSRLVIVEVQDGQLAEVSSTFLVKDKDLYARNIQDFYLDQDRLFLVSEDQAAVRRESNYGGYTFYKYYTTLSTYDISDRSAPRFLGSVWQDGNYAESRKKDGVVYLFSRYYPDIRDTMEDSDFIPMVNNDPVPVEKVCIPECVNDTVYLIVSSVKPEDPANAADTDVLVSGGSKLYVSPNSIYSLNQDWSRGDRTEIVRQDYKDGEIESRYSCFVKGSVKDSFCIDEYDGHLRVLSTYFQNGSGLLYSLLEQIFDYDDSFVRKNALTIFDEELRQVGSISGIARNEELKSARFSGDTAYFVTFRNTDPLFCVDLSDPEHPRITGALKVSGYSAYLHPFGPERMVGFGYEADETFGGVTGLKISLFDTEDAADMKELSRVVIPGITYCPGIENYKSVFASPEKSLVGFFCDNRYFLYSVNEEEIRREMIYDYYLDELTEDDYANMVRGLYIGDYFYVVGTGYVLSFSLDDYSRIQVLRLDAEADEK